VLSATKRAFEILAYLSASIFLALYFMIDRDRLRGAVFRPSCAGPPHPVLRVLLNLERSSAAYIRGQVITWRVDDGIHLVLLLVCGVPNALAWQCWGARWTCCPTFGPAATIVARGSCRYGNGR